jgi:23S rRNA pseudouridine955/2504/2580 synthase
VELITGENDAGRRLDRILRKALPDHPLPLLHRLLRQGKVLADGKPARAQDRIESGVKLYVPSVKIEKKPSVSAYFSGTPDIIWQGSGLIAVNKPAGLAVHGPKSLDTIVCSFFADKLPPSLSFKPGPLHRLDKPSSGIVVFSANLEGARLFSSLMQERKVHKIYLAIVEGNVDKEEIWKDCLVRDKDRKKTFISQEKTGGSKNAATKIKPLAVSGGYSLITAEIATGRTHQIRAQAAFHGHPLLGDRKYSGHMYDRGGFFLHAWKMDFLCFSIEAPLPDKFREKIEALFGKLSLKQQIF